MHYIYVGMFICFSFAYLCFSLKSFRASPPQYEIFSPKFYVCVLFYIKLRCTFLHATYTHNWVERIILRFQYFSKIESFFVDSWQGQTHNGPGNTRPSFPVCIPCCNIFTPSYPLVITARKTPIIICISNLVIIVYGLNAYNNYHSILGRRFDFPESELSSLQYCTFFLDRKSVV